MGVGALDLARLALLNARANAAKVAANRNATPEEKQQAQTALNKATADVMALMPKLAKSPQGEIEKVSNESSKFKSALPWIIGGVGIAALGTISYKLLKSRKGKGGK